MTNRGGESKSAKKKGNRMEKHRAKASGSKKAKQSIRNTVTELKPLIKSDKLWIDARRKFILKHIKEMMELKASGGEKKFQFSVEIPKGYVDQKSQQNVAEPQ